MKLSRLWLLFLALFFIVPLLLMVWQTFDAGAWSRTLRPEFWRTWLDTVILAVAAIGLGQAAALAVVWKTPVLLRLSFAAAALAALLPPFMLALGLGWLFINLGLGNSYAALVAAHSLAMFPYLLFFTLLGARRIPEDVFALARLNAAGLLSRFTNFYLPIMKPALLAGIFLAFTVSLSQYVLTLMLSSTVTLAVRMVPFIQSADFRQAAIYGLVFLLNVPILLVGTKKLLKTS